MQHQTVPQTRTIKARYLTVGSQVVYSNGDSDPVAAIDRVDDDVIVTFADGAKASYYVEEGVTVAGAKPAESAPAKPAFPGFAPGEHRQLLADVHRWMRTNGATNTWRGWIDQTSLDNSRVAVMPERHGFTVVWRKGDGRWQHGVRYEAFDAGQAVDLLVALTILPPAFSSQYRLGRRDGEWIAKGWKAEASTDSAETDPRQKLAAELHRIAADIVRLDLPTGRHSSLHLGVVDSRADLDLWADYLGTALAAPDGTGIPHVGATIKLGDAYGPVLTVTVQSPKEESEAEQLRARVAELEAQLAAGVTR